MGMRIEISFYFLFVCRRTTHLVHDEGYHNSFPVNGNAEKYYV